jgi:hypothetical protein
LARFKKAIIRFLHIEAFFFNFEYPGTDVMILKIFSPKNSAEKLAFLSQNKAKF